MGRDTLIQWTDVSRSPWIGCTKVSPGCLHCYAELETLPRVERAAGRETWGKGAPRYRVLGFEKEVMADERRAEREGRRIRVFPSMCDPFDEEVNFTWFSEFADLVKATPHLIWLLLTKRPESERAFLKWPENVWIGVSVEDQPRADERIPKLLELPVAHRFVSYEPALGPVEFQPVWFGGYESCTGHYPRQIDWLIVGGESGPRARPCNLEWIRLVIVECDVRTPCFVKQLGSRAFSFDKPAARHRAWQNMDVPPRLEYHLMLNHKKGGDPDEWPEDLRVRELPDFGI
jgi:protein gp37